MSQNFILGSSGPLNYGDIVPFNIRNLPSVQGGTSLSNVNIKSGNPTIRPNIPYNNIYTQPRIMIGTSGRPIPDPVLGKGINVNNWTGGIYTSGGNPVIPNASSFSRAGIKGFGGPAGAAMMAMGALGDAVKHAWNQQNLNTMSPSKRNAILKAAGREGDIKNYSRQQDTLDDYLMSPLARAVANLTQSGVNKVKNNIANNKTGGGNNTGSSTNAGGKGTRGIGGQPTAQTQALALAQQLGSNPPIANQQDADAQQANINAINDYISKLQEINQPYIESLQKFVDNYSDLYNQNQLYNRRMRDLSAITGSPLWYQSAKDYNPLEVEATKIDLQKKIQDAQAGDLNAINEIMGNLAMAQEMGLSPEAAFANKNLLTAMTMRDRNLTNREIAQLNNAAKLQIALQNAQNRLAVQNLRNQGSMANALIYAGQYGQPAVGLNQQGIPSNVPASYDVMLQSAHNKNNR